MLKLKKDIPISRAFTYFIISLFILQAGFVVWFVYFQAGNAMVEIQKRNVEADLKTNEEALQRFLSDRLALLKDYAKFPIFANMAMHPEQSKGNLVDFMGALSFLGEKPILTLLDFQGKVIHTTGNERGHDRFDQPWVEMLVNSENYSYIGVAPKSGPQGKILSWLLAVPVLYNGLPEGVLLIQFPAKLGYLPEYRLSPGRRITLLHHGVAIDSKGSVESGSQTITTSLPYEGVRMSLDVSDVEITESRNNLLVNFLGILFVAMALLILLFHRLGRKLFIVPQAKLLALSQELELKVEERTSDLQEKGRKLAAEIAEREAAQEEVLESERLLQAILDGINAGIVIVDIETMAIVEVNAMAENLLGISSGELVGKGCGALEIRVQGEHGDRMTCRLDRGKRLDAEALLVRPDGVVVPTSWNLLSLHRRGRPQLVEIFFDITERKNLERQLSIAQKLESIGQLASGIAHEMNTPIQYVGDSIRFVQDGYDDLKSLLDRYEALALAVESGADVPRNVKAIKESKEEIDLPFLQEEIPKAFKRILEGVARVAGIVQAMKKFSHPGGEEKRTVDVNRALEDTVTISRNEWKYASEVVMDPDPNLPPILGLPGDLNQVFLNLLINAAHAVSDKVGDTGEKGRIIFKTTQVGDFVEITISDTGTGIPIENQDRIFDPFFTTKDVGRGTGQGLAISHDIVVNKHGGTISLESEPGQGATFTIRLPIQPT